MTSITAQEVSDLDNIISKNPKFFENTNSHEQDMDDLNSKLQELKNNGILV